ncbi:hypothetical protein SCACP_30580 [Sporomusa carbonis]|uniref:BRO family protein n=1 Tax=Sporomusa carbonis TaxID=3076075 RepID=UPI003A626EDB
MGELELVRSAMFGNVACDFYRQGNDIAMTREQIGRALEYPNPKRALSDMHKKHKERLDKFSVVRKIRTTDGKEYNTYLYSARGIYEICRHSTQPKADAFYDFVYDILEGLRTGAIVAVSAEAGSVRELLQNVYVQLDLIQAKVLALEEAAERKPWPKKINKAGMAEVVLSMRREGRSLREITQALTAMGVVVSLATVGRYCQKVNLPRITRPGV